MKCINCGADYDGMREKDKRMEGIALNVLQGVVGYKEQGVG